MNPYREAKTMMSEEIELLTIGTSTGQGRLGLPPKVLRPMPRSSRIIITIIFILLGLACLALILLLPATLPLPATFTSYGGKGLPCPQSTVFSIDYPFGDFPYDAVKSIDAMWNLIVGRGLQVFVTWLCYKIFGMALLRITQQKQVSVELYSAICFHPVGIMTIPKLLRALVSKCGWRGWMTFLWFIAAISYVLTSPTLLDLMTGYVATSTAMGPSADGGLTPLNSTDLQSPTAQYYLNGSWIYGADAVTCVPGNTYQWGFALNWIVIFFITTTVWCWGMFGLWFDAQKHSILWRNGRRPGLYRNILDVSNVLQEALGPNTCAYGNDELLREVEKMGSVGFEAVCDGAEGYIALCHEPSGCAALIVHGIEYRGKR